MNITRIIKTIAVTGSLLASIGMSGVAMATPNTSTYAMQLSGSTVTVTETNAEAVNTVGAYFSYTGDTGSFTISPAAGGTFTTCLEATANAFSCTILGGSASTGTPHSVASLTFVPKAGVTSGTITVSMTSNSSVLASADGSETLNKSSLPSKTYTYTAPATGSTSGSGSGSTSKTTSTTKKAAAVAVGSTNGSSNTQGGAAAATVTTDSDGNVKAASVTTIKKTEAAETAVPSQSNTAAWILAGLLIVGLAILAFLRREQLGAFAASARNKFTSKPSAKAAKPAATTVASKTTAQRISKK